MDLKMDSAIEAERRLHIIFERPFHDYALELGGFYFLGRSYRTYVAWTIVGQEQPEIVGLV